MLLSSGYEFEGYDIIEYIGYESAQVVLGTGFFSSLGNSFADFLGTSSTTYENKLNNAEQICKQKLVSKAIESGCNAIIGIDVDYTTFTNDVMGVIVSGTFVKVMKKVPEKKMKSFTLKRYSLVYPVRCCNAILINMIKERKIYLRVSGKLYDVDYIVAMGVNVECTTLFGDRIIINDVMFADIEKINDFEFNTEYVEINMDDNVFKMVKYIDIIIDKYIVRDKIIDVDSKQDIISTVSESTLNVLREKNGCDAVNIAYRNLDKWKCCCGQTNAKESAVCSFCQRRVEVNNLRLVLAEGESVNTAFEYAEHKACIMQCQNAKEICEYFKQMGIEDSIIDNEIIPELEELKEIERLYGNRKESAIKFLDKIYEKTI